MKHAWDVRELKIPSAVVALAAVPDKISRTWRGAQISLDSAHAQFANPLYQAWLPMVRRSR